MNAERRYEEKEVVKVEKVESGVTLELTEKEASDLLAIVGHISGPTNSSPRGTASAIFYALKDLGVAASEIKPRVSMEFGGW